MYTVGDIVRYQNEYTCKTGIVIELQTSTHHLPRIKVLFQEAGNVTHWLVVGDKRSTQYVTNLSR